MVQPPLSLYNDGVVAPKNFPCQVSKSPHMHVAPSCMHQHTHGTQTEPFPRGMQRVLKTRITGRQPHCEDALTTERCVSPCAPATRGLHVTCLGTLPECSRVTFLQSPCTPLRAPPRPCAPPVPLPWLRPLCFLLLSPARNGCCLLQEGFPLLWGLCQRGMCVLVGRCVVALCGCNVGCSGGVFGCANSIMHTRFGVGA